MQGRPRSCHEISRLRPAHARFQHVAPAWPLGDLTIDVKRHETAVIEDRLRAFERPDGWLLHDDAGVERIRIPQFSRQRVPARRVADAPDPLARGAEAVLTKNGRGDTAPALPPKSTISVAGCGTSSARSSIVTAVLL